MLRPKHTNLALLATTLSVTALVFTLAPAGLAADGGRDQRQGASSRQSSDSRGSAGVSRGQDRTASPRTASSSDGYRSQRAASTSASQGRQSNPGATMPTLYSNMGRRSSSSVTRPAAIDNSIQRNTSTKSPRTADVRSKDSVRAPGLAGSAGRLGRNQDHPLRTPALGRGSEVRGVDFHSPRFAGGFYHYDNAPRFRSSGFLFGFWAFDDCYGCYSSPFGYYGFGYIYGPRVVIVDVPTYSYDALPDSYYSGSYYLSPGSYSGMNNALDDIKNAWLTNNSSLITRHIDTEAKLPIYLDGTYSYSVSGADYRDMTTDAMANITTETFTIYKVEQRSDGAYTAFAKHEFRDADNNSKLVYVSYTLTKSDGKWVIVATGSSENELD